MVIPALLILAPQTPSARVDVYVRAPGEIRQWNLSPSGPKLRAKFTIPNSKVGNWFVVSPAGRFLAWDDRDAAKLVVLDRKNSSKLVRLPQTEEGRVFVSDRWLVLTGPITYRDSGKDRSPADVWAYSLPSFALRKFQIRTYMTGLVDDTLLFHDQQVPLYTIRLSLQDPLRAERKLPDAIQDDVKARTYAGGGVQLNRQIQPPLVISKNRQSAFLHSLQVAGWSGRLWGQRIASTVAKATLYNSIHDHFWSAKWEADGKTLWILSNARYRTATGDFPKYEKEQMHLYSFNRWGKMLSQRNIDIPGFKQTYHVAMTVQ